MTNEKMKNKVKLSVMIKENKLSTAIISVFILFCFSTAIYWIVKKAIRNFLMSFLFMAIAPLFYFASKILKLRFGPLFVLGILFLATGSLLGAGFNFYTIIPIFDTILHCTSGLIFTSLGVALSKRLFDTETKTKSFAGHLLFGFCFSLAIALLWEIFEYAGTVLLGEDMQEDSLVTKINSYYLAGSHNEIVTIDGITKTVIHYGDGQTYVIDGYLDLGLVDTLHDMIICLVGTVFLVILSALSNRFFPKVNELLIPQYYDGVAVCEEEIEGAVIEHPEA